MIREPAYNPRGPRDRRVNIHSFPYHLLAAMDAKELEERLDCEITMHAEEIDQIRTACTDKTAEILRLLESIGNRLDSVDAKF